MGNDDFRPFFQYRTCPVFVPLGLVAALSQLRRASAAFPKVADKREEGCGKEDQRRWLGNDDRRKLDRVEVGHALVWATRGNRLESEHDVLLTREGGDVADIRFDRSVIGIDYRRDGIERRWDRRAIKGNDDVGEAEQVRAKHD